MHSNVIQIDRKCKKTGKCYSTRISSTERRPQYKSDKNKRLGALSKKHNILSHLIERASPRIALASKNKKALRRSFEKYNFLLHLINMALKLRVAHDRKKTE